MTDPCFISRYLTWVSEHMEASEKATMEYYANEGKPCLIPAGLGSTDAAQERPDPVVMDLSLQVDGDFFIRLHND